MQILQKLSSIVIALCAVAAPQVTTHRALSQATSSPAAQGELSSQVPRFDVISVRESKSPIIQQMMPANGYVGHGVFFTQLIMAAYSIPQLDRLQGAPTWKTEKQFEVQAKVDDADIPALAKLSNLQRNAMLQQILVEKFHLALHEEQQLQPIYILTAGPKPGPFLVKSRPNGADSTSSPHRVRTIRRSRKGQLTDEWFPMADFANQLAGIVHKYVANETGLEGPYDLQLDWNPEDALSTASEAADGGQTDSAKALPSIFTALQEQLGLKLKPAKGPVKVWVIDHVELPSEN